MTATLRKMLHIDKNLDYLSCSTITSNKGVLVMTWDINLHLPPLKDWVLFFFSHRQVWSNIFIHLNENHLGFPSYSITYGEFSLKSPRKRKKWHHPNSDLCLIHSLVFLFTLTSLFWGKTTLYRELCLNLSQGSATPGWFHRELTIYYCYWKKCKFE